VLLIKDARQAESDALTCTRDSGKLIFRATSSLMKMSGYLVLPKSDSSTSSCALVKVVRSLRCFRGFTPVKSGGFVSIFGGLGYV
jgi:hypothetical protein